MDNAVSAEKIFKVLAWLELIRPQLFLAIPYAIQYGTEMMASIGRIEVSEVMSTIRQGYCRNRNIFRIE